MAKGKAPLLGLGATGAIGKTTVNTRWKGQKVVKRYPKLTNPQTSSQRFNRWLVKEAVRTLRESQALSSHPFDAADKAAYALLAKTEKSPRTWFNQIVKIFLNHQTNNSFPVIYRSFTIIDADIEYVTFDLWLSEAESGELEAGKFYFGLTPTALVIPVTASIDIGKTAYLDEVDLTGVLSPNTRYFWQFRPDPGDECEGMVSGIYSFTPTTEPP